MLSVYLENLFMKRNSQNKSSRVHQNWSWVTCDVIFYKVHWTNYTEIRSSYRRCSVRKDILTNFSKFTGKHLYQSLGPEACNFIKIETGSLYFDKVAGLKPEALAQVFFCEFWEISQNTFFTEHVWATASKKFWYGHDLRTCTRVRLKIFYHITTIKEKTFLRYLKNFHKDCAERIKYFQPEKCATICSRGGSRAAATSKMEHFVIIVNDWKPLTIITKCPILDVAAALDPLLRSVDKLYIIAVV